MARGGNGSTAVARRIDLLMGLREALASASQPSSQAEEALHDVAEELLDEGISKTAAAKALGITMPTLNSWIERGVLQTLPDTSPARVSRDDLLRVAEILRRLREGNSGGHLLRALVAALEQEDPVYRKDFDELYGKSLERLRRGEPRVPALPTVEFGPGD